MSFQRDHQLMPVRIIDHLIHQLLSKTMMLCIFGATAR